MLAATNTRGYIPSLDGLRAVSIAIVFVAHAGLDHLIPGGFGVTVFFFLSGYLITTLARREIAANGNFDFGGFYLRRVWRIFPPFYFALAFAVVVGLVGLTSKPIGWGAVAGQALHVANIWEMVAGDQTGFPAGTGVLWSLAVEEHFYFLFPITYVALSRRFGPRTQAAVLLAICGAVLAWRCVLVFGFDVSENRIYIGTDTRLDAILFGSVLAIHQNPMDDAPPAWSPAKRLALLSAAVAVILATFVIRNPEFRNTLRYSVQSLALFVIFRLAVGFPTDAVFRPLQWRWVRTLGTLSYSFYLLHFTVLAVMVEQFESTTMLTRGIAAFIITLALSYLVHLLIERPTAAMRRRHRPATAPVKDPQAAAI